MKSTCKCRGRCHPKERCLRCWIEDASQASDSPGTQLKQKAFLFQASLTQDYVSMTQLSKQVFKWLFHSKRQIMKWHTDFFEMLFFLLSSKSHQVKCVWKDFRRLRIRDQMENFKSISFSLIPSKWCFLFRKTQMWMKWSRFNKFARLMTKLTQTQVFYLCEHFNTIMTHSVRRMTNKRPKTYLNKHVGNKTEAL